MMTIPQFAAQLPNAAMAGLSAGTGSSVSAGTTPSSLCSTPVTLLGQQALYVPHFPSVQQMQLTGASSLEGLPIFVLPQNTISQGVSLSALQRAAETKNGLLLPATAEPKVDTSKHHHIFIGDLSPDVDVKALKDAFEKFGEVSEAKVIRDAQTQKSRGYGFVSFPDKENAEKAMAEMNGTVLGRRAIRTNWATRKPSDEAKEKLTFEQVFNSTKPDNTSVYVGNVQQATTENDLREAFKEFGPINEVRIFKTQGYAFVRFDKKEDATKAIMDMNGKSVNGQPVRCSWGRVQQQSQATVAPLMADFSPLLAAQQLMQPAAFTPQMTNPFWSPLAGYNPYLPSLPTPLLPQFM